MTNLSPSRLLVHAAEQIHIVAASLQHFHVYAFPEPFGMIIVWLVILPLMSITLRWWAFVFFALSFAASAASDGLYQVSLWPTFLNTQLVRLRKHFGRLVVRLGKCVARLGRWLLSSKSDD